VAAVKILGKINGAVGNFNAHIAAYPEINWNQVAQQFVEETLKLHWNQYTTQIEPHDMIAELLQSMSRFNVVLLDLDRGFWSYIWISCFLFKAMEGEIGRATG